LQRALAISALATGLSTLNGISWADDTRAVRGLVEQLGAKCLVDDDSIRISPLERISTNATKLHVGESGLALRMFSSIITLFNRQIELNGHGSLEKRPVQPIIEALQKTGANIQSTNSGLPLHISGPIQSSHLKLDGSFSSQIISGLLITLPLLNHNSKLIVDNPTSIPYLQMTLDVMSHFGVYISHQDFQQFQISGNQQYHGQNYNIEGDWSGMANHVVGAAISGSVTLRGLQQNSAQADRKIIEAVKQFGADIKYTDDTIFIKKDGKRAFNFDATHCPDIFPPLVVLGCASEGDCTLTGTDRLRHKESDRLTVLVDVFEKLGAHFTVKPNQMIIHGTGKLDGGDVHSHHDHRIAMAVAIASCISKSPIKIDQANAVNKSYPEFFNDVENVQVLAE